MKKFMDQDFLLSTPTAQHLYHDYAEKMPIIDYHCHINPKEVYEDTKFENITKMWIINGTAGDHYKWRLMRANGYSEKYITGDASDYEKFCAFAATLEKAIGNPIYHWSHLELQRYFDYHGVLNSKTAPEVWELCNKKLQQADMSARNIIRKSNVKLICTTDDPVDTLEWHKAVAEDETFECKMLPTFRPDKATKIEDPTFAEYINQLAKVAEIEINSFSALKEAISKRLDHFNAHGCKISDHGLDYITYAPASEEEVEAIFQKGLKKEALTDTEVSKYKSAFLLFLGKKYTELDWAMQLHYSCKRNNNKTMFGKIGPDTGYDAINNYGPASEMADFFNALHAANALPRTVTYSLNPNDDAIITTIMGCFQGNEEGILSRMQHGSAWWFNDHKTGMINQITNLGNSGLLGNFVGMLTDSRSFLSYTRHEYFRRILCEVVGNWVENGEYPNDEESLKTIIEGISFENSNKYFGFNLEK